MFYRKLAVSSILAAVLTACSSESAKLGSYIASDDDMAFMVQIASIEDGRVNGSLSVITSDENGKTAAVTRPLSGTIEDDALNLSVENGNGLSLVTGAVEQDHLRLTFFANGNSTQLNFTKSEAGKFEELVNATRHHAAEKRQEVETAAALKGRIEQRAMIQKSIDQHADSFFSKAQEMQEKARKVEVVIAGYQAARERIGKMRQAKRQIGAASPEAEFRVSQINFQLDSVSNELEGTHDQVQNYMQSLNGFMADAASQSPQRLAECQADKLLNCARLSAGLQALRTQYQQFQESFERENAAFEATRS